MKIKDKRKAGSFMGREGLAKRIIEIAEEIAEGSYKQAIQGAGKISVLVDACGYDEYWEEKALDGKTREQWKLEDILHENTLD